MLRAYDQVVVPEMNLGQLSLLLRGKYLVDVVAYNQVRGLPFTATELEGVFATAIDAANDAARDSANHQGGDR